MDPSTMLDRSGLRGADSPAAGWFVRELFRRPRFAHHPTCRCFDKHLLRVGPFALCLGCTCVGAGVVIAVVALAWLTWAHFDHVRELGTWTFVGFGVGLYAPTLVQPVLQFKVFKILARTMLGVAIASLWYGAMVLLPWTIIGGFLRLVFVLVFWFTYRITQRFRGRWTPNPCDSCPRGVYPFCADNRPKLAVLIAELRARARPEDHEFVEFAAALARQNGDSANIEVVSITNLLHRREDSEVRRNLP